MAGAFLTSDMKTILSPNDFGEENGIVWAGVTVTNVIFDDEDIEVETGEGVAEIMRQPIIIGASADFPNIAMGDSITIGAQTMTVRNWKDDGTGQIEIFLDRSTPTP
jgi:hypothetical protein